MDTNNISDSTNDSSGTRDNTRHKGVKEIKEQKKIEDDKWDFYSGLPNPKWYEQVEGDGGGASAL